MSTSFEISKHPVITVAMIGAGNRARKYLEYFLSNPLKAKVVAIAEPIRQRRDSLAQKAGVDTANRFDSDDAFFARGKIADAVIIASPDSEHHRQTMKAISLGYHVLLEKPIAQSDTEGEAMARAAAASGLVVNVCYVLHFHPYFAKLHQLVTSGKLGQIVSISHRAPVGIDRAAHIYVRSEWGRKESSGPLLTSKCCHDIDFLLWLTGSRCRRLSSHGSRRWFTIENAPRGAAERCIHCDTAVEASCPFSAVDLYRRRHDWISNFDFTPPATLDQAIEQQLVSGPYGRCVYHCDNNVVDRQVVAMEMESGATIDMALDLFTTDCRRSTRISLTNGEITGNELSITVSTFRPRSTEIFDFSDIASRPFHAGADLLVVDNFINAINGMPDTSHTSLNDALESQRTCDAIEVSRLQNLR